MIRLDKILSNSGVGTRREVKSILKNGLVLLNGDIVKDGSLKIDPLKDNLTVEGKTIRYREYVYLMMYKPIGVLSATEDARDTTAVDLLDEEFFHYSPAPAGRLDKDSEGLLLLTNDGAFIHSIISPKKHVEKLYEIEVEGVLTETDAQAFHEGVELDDGYITLPAGLEIIESGTFSKAYVTLREGKFRQIRRMMQSLGKEVVFLKRLAIGTLRLDKSLSEGEYRELTEGELEELFADCGYQKSK